MFSVYGETGRVFKGAMEELRHVQGVGRISRLQAAQAISPALASSDAVLGQHRVPLADVPQAPRPTPAAAHSAVAAYAQSGVTHAPRHPLSRVVDVMNRGVVVVSAQMPVLEAWQILSDKGVSQAPVVSAQGVLVGLLTRAELMRPDRLPLPGTNALVWRALLAQPVAEIMWTPVPAVDEQTEIRRLARVLLDTRLPGLPVVDEAGAVLGFVSRTDILQAVVHDPPLDLWS